MGEYSEIFVGLDVAKDRHAVAIAVPVTVPKRTAGMRRCWRACLGQAN